MSEEIQEEFKLHKVDDDIMYIDIDNFQCYVDSCGADIIHYTLNQQALLIQTLQDENKILKHQLNAIKKIANDCNR